MPLHQAIRMGTLKMKRGLSAAGYAPDRVCFFNIYVYMYKTYVHIHVCTYIIYHVQHFNTPLHSAIKRYNRPEHLCIYV